MIIQKTNWTKTQTRNPLKIYFLIMTLIGVIWTLVSFGILLLNIGKQVIITNDEYIMGDRYYEIENCKNNNYNGTLVTKEKEKKCIEERKTTLVQSRKVLFKENILEWTIWGILFLIVVLVHYPKFIKFTKKD